MDIYGAHAVTCRSGPSMIKRHNSIRNYLYGQMKIANYTCCVEKKYLDHDGKKPADIYVESLVLNKPTAVDVAVTSCTQKAILNKVNDKVYQAADHLVKAKLTKYKDFIERGDIEFVPFVVESFGGISAPAREILRRIAHDQRTTKKRCFSAIMDRLQKCICVKVWKAMIEACKERMYWVRDECSGDADNG